MSSFCSLAPPAIVQSKTTQTVTVDEGKNVNISCSATGYPKPRIKWVRGNGVNIPQPYNQFAVAVSNLDSVYMSKKKQGSHLPWKCKTFSSQEQVGNFENTCL